MDVAVLLQKSQMVVSFQTPCQAGWTSHSCTRNPRGLIGQPDGRFFVVGVLLRQFIGRNRTTCDLLFPRIPKMRFPNVRFAICDFQIFYNSTFEILRSANYRTGLLMWIRDQNEPERFIFGGVSKAVPRRQQIVMYIVRVRADLSSSH